MRRFAVLLCVVLFVALFALPARGQAFIPTATSSGGISPWENVQMGVTLTGAQSKRSLTGGASALYLGRHVQAAYAGPTIRLTRGDIRFNLLTTVGVSRISSDRSSTQRETDPSTVYSLSSMVGITIQDDARSILVGLEYSSGYEPAEGENRPRLSHYSHAQQRRLVVGVGWSLFSGW